MSTPEPHENVDDRKRDPNTLAERRQSVPVPALDWKGCIVHGRAPDEMPCIDCDAERVGLERKPGQWAFLDTDTGDWIEVRPGVVWGEALRDAV